VPPSTVLIIGDNADSAGVWGDALRYRGIESIHLRYEVQTPNLSLPDHFDLILIDSHTADNTALVLCADVRARSDKPILLLIHENGEQFQIKAYAVGVDECIVAPMSVLVFLAKIHVWLRRGAVAHSVSEEISESGFRLNLKTRRVFLPDGRAVKLSSQECRLLHLFLANPGRILQTDLLVNRIWSHDTPGDKNLLLNLIYRLRQKLDPRSSPGMHIQRIPGEGYRWKSTRAEDYHSSF
jgi:DNA-binding response OmpR family regulator